MSDATFDFEDDNRTPHDYLAIIRRRKFHLIIPTIVVAAIALAIIFSLPPTYTSQATILIEEQEVPREFVTSTISSFAAQQIQVITQRVLTAESIGRIADKYGLYTDGEGGARAPATQIAQAFRRSMSLDLVSAEVIDPRSGRAQQATIAFTLAFDHRNPSTAQKVTNELVTLFLDENLRNRAERTASTEAFLSAEAASLAAELSEIEAELADFKLVNEGALPESQQFNLSSLERATNELSDTDTRLRELSKRKLELSTQMSQINPWVALVADSGETILGDQERLELLRREYRQQSTLYTPGHPNIQRLKREISGLEAALAAGGSDAENGTGPAPDNPAYLMLDAQRTSMIVEEGMLLEKRNRLSSRIDRIEERMSRAPSVERDYQALRRGYETAQAKYQEIRAKQREAGMAESLERERKGERFAMLEPPNLPLDPSSPNRPVLALLGLMLALGSGVGMLMLMEFLDRGIYG
ncbi:MAG: GumC family protein, partial [Pseudomonadales bacterium]